MTLFWPLLKHKWTWKLFFVWWIMCKKVIESNQMPRCFYIWRNITSNRKIFAMSLLMILMVHISLDFFILYDGVCWHNLDQKPFFRVKVDYQIERIFKMMLFGQNSNIKLCISHFVTCFLVSDIFTKSFVIYTKAHSFRNDCHFMI